MMDPVDPRARAQGTRYTFFAGAIVAAIALAGCGGGGGASTTPPATAATTGNVSSSRGLGSIPGSGTTSIPNQSTSTITYSGAVVDSVTGAPISGAKVIFDGMSGPASVTSQQAHRAAGGASRYDLMPQPSLRVYKTAATRRIQTLSVSGTFTYSAQPGDVQSVVVSAPGYTTYTSGVEFPAASTTLRSFTLTAVAAPIVSWLARVNGDRAAYGAAALSLDESITEAAAQHATEMQSGGYFAHYDLEGRSPSQQCAAFYSLVDCGQNIAEGFATANAAEGAFMAEASACPVQPASFANCPFSDAAGAVTGHFVNIVDPNYATVGLAIAGGSGPYYVEDFGTAPAGGVYDPTAVPAAVSPSSTVSVNVRVFGAAGVYANVYSDNCVSRPVARAQLSASYTPPACSATSPAMSGISLTQSSEDPNLIQLTATAPASAGHLYLGVASGNAVLVIVPVPVN